MSKWQEFRATIKRGQCGVISQPNIMANLTGAHSAYIARNNSVKLHYMDGSTETARLTDAEIEAGLDNWFSMVDAVQSRRPQPIHHKHLIPIQ